MNAKYAVALILALQVSMCLCEIPTPSAELVEKFNGMKTKFSQRIANLLTRMTTGLEADRETTQTAQTVKGYLDEIQAAAKPMSDAIDRAFLGLYEHYLRPQIGAQLSDAIDQIKVHLDQHLPAE